MTDGERYQSLLRLPVKTIAVWRPLKLGDFLVGVPALRALRAAFPRATIDYIGLPLTKEAADHFRIYVDNYIDFPGLPGLPERSWKPDEILRFFKKMQRRRYDLLLQLHGNGRVVNHFVPLCDAVVTAGMAGVAVYRPNEDWFTEYPEHQHMILKQLHLLEFLGIPLVGTALEFPILKADADELRRLLAQTKLTTPYVCLHAGAVSSQPWRADYFAAVGDECKRMGFTVVLTGTDREAPLVRAVAQLMHEQPIVVAGMTSLGGLAALMQGAALFVGNDAGPSHLAVALGVVSIVIFSTADASLWAPLDIARHHVILPSEATPERVIRKVHEVFGI